MDDLSLLKLLAEDRFLISYRPALRKVIGGVLPTILLQQVVYWHYKSGKKPFYKFARPCQHELYRAGDSWEEELAFTRRELDSSMKLIATKVQSGFERAAVLSVKTLSFSKEGEIQNLDRLVAYWRTSNHSTFFLLNEPLFLAVLTLAYSEPPANDSPQDSQCTDRTLANAGFVHSYNKESETTFIGSGSDQIKSLQNIEIHQPKIEEGLTSMGSMVERFNKRPAFHKCERCFNDLIRSEVEESLNKTGHKLCRACLTNFEGSQG